MTPQNPSGEPCRNVRCSEAQEGGTPASQANLHWCVSVHASTPAPRPVHPVVVKWKPWRTNARIVKTDAPKTHSKKRNPGAKPGEKKALVLGLAIVEHFAPHRG